MNLEEIKARQSQRLGTDIYMREIIWLIAEVERLNCNSVACHYQRDVLDSIYEAMTILPCNGVQAILCAAAQEIQALRGEVERLNTIANPAKVMYQEHVLANATESPTKAEFNRNIETYSNALAEMYAAVKETIRPGCVEN